MRYDDENFSDGYYHLLKDIEKYPDASIYVISSGRGPGKTYSALWGAYRTGRTIAYIKRCKRDVDLILEQIDEDGIRFDASPYSPIIRDKGIKIKSMKIDDGIGAFYNVDDDGNATGAAPFCYVLALSAVKDIKGFELSACDWIIFDEYIPLPGEAVKQSEGESLLSIVRTIGRDRIMRGKDPTKLILLSNTDEISCPITNALELVDILAEMIAEKTLERYIESRKIYVHLIGPDEFEVNKAYLNDPLYLAMQGTAWAEKAYLGEFASNDFSCIKKQSLKNSRCLYKLIHKRKNIYIYINTVSGTFYATSIPGKYLKEYNLAREVEQKSFYLDHGIDLRLKAIQGKFFFQKYSFYDLILNFKKFYKI